MDQIKVLRSSRRTTKREANMAPELTWMTERIVDELAVANDRRSLGEVLKNGAAGMTETPVPCGWRRSGDEDAGSRGR
jgi:predicted DNA-binding ArsR family transcriptional regulator